jgi:hypothetical protein
MYYPCPQFFHKPNKKKIVTKRERWVWNPVDNLQFIKAIDLDTGFIVRQSNFFFESLKCFYCRSSALNGCARALAALLYY